MIGKGSELFFKEFISENGQPLYYQMYESIRNAILEKRFNPGEKLPPTRSISKFCKVSRSTVQTAFDLLMAEGYIYGQGGSGTFVSRNLPEQFLNVSAPDRLLHSNDTITLNYSEFGERLLNSSYKNKTPEKIVPFKPGIPSLKDFPMDLWSRIAFKSVKDLSHPNMSYSDSQGLLKLREMISLYLRQSRGVKCSADQIVIINGSQQALTLISTMFLNPHDDIIVEDPTYPGALDAFKTSGAKINYIPVDRDGIDVKKIIESNQKVKLVYTSPSHQYPLGPTLSLKRRLQLLEWAAKTSTLILEDDYDSEYRYTGNPLSSLQGMAAKSPVIYIGTYSKVLYPGLRLGYMVLPQNLVESFSLAKTIFDRNAPMLEQLILARFMEEGHFGRHLRRMRVIYEERQQVLVDEFNKHLADFGTINPCHAGLHLVSHLNRRFNDEEVSQRAVSHNLNMHSLSKYCSRRNDLNGLMLGYSAFDIKEIKQGIAMLKEVLAQF